MTKNEAKQILVGARPNQNKEELEKVKKALAMLSALRPPPTQGNG